MYCHVQCILFPLASARNRWVETLPTLKLGYLNPCNLQFGLTARNIQQTFTLSDTSELLSVSNLDHSLVQNEWKRYAKLRPTTGQKNLILNWPGKEKKNLFGQYILVWKFLKTNVNNTAYSFPQPNAAVGLVILKGGSHRSRSFLDMFTFNPLKTKRICLYKDSVRTAL
jgi:hypothetical protein